MRSTFLRSLSRCCCLLGLAVLTALGLQAQTTVNLLNYTGYSGCPGYPLPAAHPSPSNNELDVRPQLQAAIDYVANNGGGTVTIPGDLCSWYLSKPVFLDRDNVTLDGTGAATLAPMNGSECPTLVLGTPRQVSGLEITSSHRTDLSTVGMDSSIPAATYYGLNTKGLNQAGTGTVYAHGYFDGCTAASGPNTSTTHCTRWLCPLDSNGNPLASQYRFTFDIAIKQNTAGTLTGTICGSGMANDMTQPETYWMLGTFPNDADPTNVKFKFKTGNPDAGTYTIQSLVLGPITDTNVHRITVQMDMGAGTCAAWLDGTETATLALGSVLNGDGTVNVNQQLWRYEQGAFQLGQLNSGALGTPTAGGLNDTQQQVNWTYCGFQLSNTLLYNWAATLARADSGQITDAWRYFNNWSGLSNFTCNLQLTDNPSSTYYPSIGTVCTMLQGGYYVYAGQTFGFWLPQRMPFQDTDGNYGVQNLALQNINLAGPLLVGEARELALTNVIFSVYTTNFYAVDDLNCGVMNNGVLPTFTDTDVNNNCCNCYCFYYLCSKNITSNDAYPATTAYGSLRLVGCQGMFHYTFFDAGGINEYYYKSFAGPCGGPLTFDNQCIDNEGYPSPTKAAIYHEFSPPVNGVTRETNTLTLADFSPGTCCANVPLVVLPNTNPGWLQADRTNYGVVTAPYYLQQMVSTSNPNAYGAIDITAPLVPHWTDDCALDNCWFPYSAGNIVYNDLDGQLYSCATWHSPGNYLLTNGTQMIHEDNRPLTGEPWKQYWTRLTTPAAWSSSTPYTAGNVVSYTDGNNYHGIFQCLVSNTGQAPDPWGGNTTYWQSLQWQYGTAYTASTSYVSCDGAYYQCIKSHTSGLFQYTTPLTYEPTRPRPWDVVAANAWQIVQYTGAGSTSLKSYHSEYSTVLPPVCGAWNPWEPVIYNPDPAAVNAPTEYRNPLGGAPGNWASDDLLGTFVQP